MLWAYAFSAQTWLILGSAVLMAVLGCFGWRHRRVPGARAFAVLMALWMLWAAGVALEGAAVQLSAKSFWRQFQFFLTGPLVVTGLWFVLAYARLERRLTRPLRLALAAYLLVGGLLVLTNGAHHWVWRGFSFSGQFAAQRGPAFPLLTSSGLLLAMLNLPVLAWLFVRSPPHRWPVVLILCGQIAVRAAMIWDNAGARLGVETDYSIPAATFNAITYTVALFGLGMFDPLPLARRAVITLMRDGVLVLDPGYGIVSLNPAAERILARPAAGLRGQPISAVLPGCAGPDAAPQAGAPAPAEISLGSGPAQRDYAVDFSPLKGRSDLLLGYLILLHDVTEQKRAQARLLEQQRALAMQEERERLARELHDNLGQVLGYVSLQAQAIRAMAAGAQPGAAGAQPGAAGAQPGAATAVDAALARLAEVAQAAHTDLRDAIAGLKSGPIPDEAFLPALQQRLEAYRQRYAIETRLSIAPGIGEHSLDPLVSVQVLRVVQEALANARKHGRASRVEVAITRADGRARITITDDGQGFEAAGSAAGAAAPAAGEHYGLAFMRERMDSVGGQIEIYSQPGAGTQVALSVPLHKEPV